MTEIDVAAAVAAFLRARPDLPAQAAPVFFMLGTGKAMPAASLAKQLVLAQSEALRILAWLGEAGLATAVEGSKGSPKFVLTGEGAALADRLMAELGRE